MKSIRFDVAARVWSRLACRNFSLCAAAVMKKKKKGRSGVKQKRRICTGETIGEMGRRKCGYTVTKQRATKRPVSFPTTVHSGCTLEPFLCFRRRTL